MSSCSIEILDEKKEDATVDDHSLKSIVAFSTVKMQMMTPDMAEGLIKADDSGEKTDRRTKILFSDDKYGKYISYRALCQVTGAVTNLKKKGVGSGCGINAKDGTQYLLTCAHNLLQWSHILNKLVSFTSLKMYRMRQGENSWRCCSSMDDTTIVAHPKYDGKADCGYDIGMCQLKKVISENINNDSFKNGRISDVIWDGCYPRRLAKGMSIEIAGYPGEKHGHPYTHTGIIVAVTKTKNGGHLLWYDVDTTCGNSGSPIMITDKKYVEKYGKSPATKVVIGVHTGYSFVEGLNFGTLITPSLFRWIMKRTGRQTQQSFTEYMFNLSFRGNLGNQ